MVNLTQAEQITELFVNYYQVNIAIKYQAILSD